MCRASLDSAVFSNVIIKTVDLPYGTMEICERKILEPVPAKPAVIAFAASNWFVWKDQRAAPNRSEDEQTNDVTAVLINGTQKKTKNH